MRSILAFVLIPVFGLCGCNATPAPDAQAPHPASIAGPLARTPRRANGHGATASAPGAFDFYLLNLSWSPEFCATHASSPECPQHLGFVVHGLWPQNTDGTYPENCSNAAGPSNPSADLDLMPTLALVQHEWQTHGTCSGLDADTYFSTVRKAFHEIAIPAAYSSGSTPVSATPQQILASFTDFNPGLPASAFALSCANNRLTAIEVCLDKSVGGEACQSVHSCGATSVKITPR